jgi:hypothetical protein
MKMPNCDTSVSSSTDPRGAVLWENNESVLFVEKQARMRLSCGRMAQRDSGLGRSRFNLKRQKSQNQFKFCIFNFLPDSSGVWDFPSMLLNDVTALSAIVALQQKQPPKDIFEKKLVHARIAQEFR